WGSNDYGQSSPPSGEFMAVTVGQATTCGLRMTEYTTGTATCWGSDFQGIDLAPSGYWAELSMGSGGGCVFDRGSMGHLDCWGYPDIATIPDDIDISQISAIDVGGGTAGTSVCVVNGPGTVQCWGSGTRYWEIPR
ncbi:hypothetical protein KKC22_03335, partial [Myxococcota bacterium]|nr:hypothetical protein [Myxococcota bacterium]